MPTGIVHATGISLTGFTCTNAACDNASDAAVLSPGELLVSGQDPDPVLTSISDGNTGFSIDGLGLSMTFDTISTDGTISIDLVDPDNVQGLTGATATTGGTISTGTVIGSVMTISAGSATTTGDITITMSYLEENLAGIPEENIIISHFENGAWVEETNCTVDTVNNEVTCTVDSID
jgi:hypothetical protein